MSIDFSTWSTDQKLKAASHNFLVDTTAEAFEFWDGPFQSKLFPEGKHGALVAPMPMPKDPEKPTKAEETAIDTWQSHNVHLFHRLMMAVRMSASAAMIVSAHHDSQDGRAAYNDLKNKCLGTPTGDTLKLVALLNQLFSISYDGGGTSQMDEVVMLHSRLAQRLKQFPIVKADPLLFIDAMLKMHLLMLVQKDEYYGFVEEICADESVSYDDTIRKINAKTLRLDQSIHKTPLQ